MRVLKSVVAVAMLGIAAALAGGCAHVSPAVGTWTGQIRPNPMLAVPVQMVLTADGKGTMTIAPLINNAAMTWKEAGENTVTLEMARPASATNPAASGNPFTTAATLDKEGKTLTVAYQTSSVTLTKQADAKP